MMKSPSVFSLLSVALLVLSLSNGDAFVLRIGQQQQLNKLALHPEQAAELEEMCANCDYYSSMMEETSTSTTVAATQQKQQQQRGGGGFWNSILRHRQRRSHGRSNSAVALTSSPSQQQHASSPSVTPIEQ